MKAQRDEQGSHAINLTLETKEEADLLWYLLDYTNEKELQHSFAKQRGFDLFTGLNHRMWNSLNVVYNPRK